MTKLADIILNGNTYELNAGVEDGSITQAKLASDVAGQYAYGESSETTDILLNPLLTHTSGQYYDATNGTVINGALCARSNKFDVKSGTTILLEMKAGIVFWDKDDQFVTGYAEDGESSQTITVPSNARYAGIYCSTANLPFQRGDSGYGVKTNFRVTQFAFKSETLHIDAENIDGVDLVTMDAEIDSLSPLKHISIIDVAGIKAEIIETTSDTISLYMSRQTADKYHLGETYDTETGEIIESVGGSRFDLLYTKPNAQISVTAKINVMFFTYSEKYLGYVAGNGTFTVPENCYKLGICSPNYKIPTGDSPSVYNNVKTNCYVSDILGSFESSGLHLSELRGLGDAEAFEASDMSPYFTFQMMKASNRLRHAFRVASWNIYGAGRTKTNWTAIKNRLPQYGIDLIGFQEVSDPLGRGSDTTKFADVVGGWHLSQFSDAVSFDGNARIVAGTSEFVYVDGTDTVYDQQANYGNRYYARTEFTLPTWKGKYWSDHLKISVYDTQLEVGTSTNYTNTRLAQARQLVQAMQSDPNPFIILVGDFNEMTTDQSTFAIIREAGFTQVFDGNQTPTCYRGFYDNIFVNDRISIVNDDVVPITEKGDSISDHNLIMADVVFDYSNIIVIKKTGENCTISGENWLDRRSTDPVTITVTADEGYTVSSITVGQGDNDLSYNNGAITKSGNTITVTPNLVAGDMWISVTTTANS